MSGAAGWRPQRRFWREATVGAIEGGWTVRLDGRPVSTPARALLRAPTRGLAEAVAAEWRAQGETVTPRSMPLTRALNSAIDRVAPQAAAVRAEIAGYAETDLLCYRAPHPEALAARQAEAWDPLLAWARARHGAGLLCAAGVMHVAQRPDAVARLTEAVAARDVWRLTALSDLVALSGSLVIGLMVDEGALEAEAGWAASRVDETWQIEQWGEDAEAAAAAAEKRADFLAAARLTALLRG
ncbi:MAG: ATPase [Rhodobacteraceae bacterium]|nr:MAG: ATPase [Paracoccaceae bacterium]